MVSVLPCTKLKIPFQACSNPDVRVLVPRSDPTTIDFLKMTLSQVACSYYPLSGIVYTPFVPFLLPNAEQVAYAVAYLFTPEFNRSKGYARYMTRLLHYILTDPENLLPFSGEPPQIPEGCGNVNAFTLYRTLGPFYDACGPSASPVPTRKS